MFLKKKTNTQPKSHLLENGVGRSIDSALQKGVPEKTLKQKETAEPFKLGSDKSETAIGKSPS